MGFRIHAHLRLSDRLADLTLAIKRCAKELNITSSVRNVALKNTHLLYVMLPDRPHNVKFRKLRQMSHVACFLLPAGGVMTRTHECHIGVIRKIRRLDQKLEAVILKLFTLPV